MKWTFAVAKILIVDDEKLSIRMLQGLLEKNIHEVITATDGQKGLAKVKTENLDLIILDVMMPGMTGLQVCRTLKNNYSYKKIPIIILSSLDKEDDIKSGKDAGADAYFIKPYNADNLLAKVEELLEKSKDIRG